MQEMQVRPLDQEDPLEEDMATDSSILACEIPRTEEPGILRSLRHKESNTTEATKHARKLRSYSWQIVKWVINITVSEITCYDMWS